MSLGMNFMLLKQSLHIISIISKEARRKHEGEAQNLLLPQSLAHLSSVQKCLMAQHKKKKPKTLMPINLPKGKCLPIPPPHVRPSVMMDSSSRSEASDDLTHHQLAMIIRHYENLKRQTGEE
ncbi:hypothetical protein RJT34_24295 [Clitoria ternatea]|uniref:DNA-directed RNA polymerase n=1 Tax=Clitoria ternatea TaxID=43366 RepID=A0AAN9IFR7_CLITE